MVNTKKSIVSSLILLIVMSLIFNGCSIGKVNMPKSVDSTGKTNNLGTGKGGNSNPEAKKDIVWLTGTLPEQSKLIVERWNKKNPDISITIIQHNEYQAQHIHKRFRVAMAARTRVDVIDNTEGTGFIRPLVYDKLILPIEEYVKKDGLDLNKVFFPGAYITCAFSLTGREDDKKLYTLPAVRTVYPVFYNKEMLDSAGMSEPPMNWTWDDFVDYSKKLTKGEGANKVFGAWLPLNQGWFAIVPAQMAGYGVMKEINGNKAANFDDKYLKKVMSIFYKISVQDKTAPSLTEITSGGMDGKELFVNSKVAMLVAESQEYLNYFQRAKALGKLNFELGTVALPRLDKYLPDDVSASEIGGGFCIAETSKYPEDAYKFIKFLTVECTDIIRKLPATISNKKQAMLCISSYINENGKRYDNLFNEHQLRAFFDPREGMKTKFWEVNVENEFVQPLVSVMGDEISNYLQGMETLEEAIETMRARGQHEIENIELTRK